MNLEDALAIGRWLRKEASYKQQRAHLHGRDDVARMHLGKYWQAHGAVKVLEQIQRKGLV